MKRNRYSFFIILFWGVLYSAYPQRTDVSFGLEGQTLEVLLLLGDIKGEEIIVSLKENQTVEIDFVLKAFVESGGLWFFDNSLFREITVVYSARWNPVTQMYTIEGGGMTESFTDSKMFLDTFLTHKFILDVSDIDMGKSYVSCRIRLNTFKLLPPFIILEPFFKGSTITTPWVRRNIRQ